MLKRVWVPSEEELYHRQVVRRRRQLVRDRVRTQSRIKAELRFYGVLIEEPRGKWTQLYFENLRRVNFGNRWMQESFNRLLEQYEFLSAQIDKQTQLLRELSETELYQERVKILQSIPGVGKKDSQTHQSTTGVVLWWSLDYKSHDNCFEPDLLIGRLTFRIQSISTLFDLIAPFFPPD